MDQKDNGRMLWIREAEGAVPIRLTNDYLFRALMQLNEEARKSLIGALLHLPPGKIQSASVENPIELGTHVEDKEFFLDVKVLFNNNEIVNLEMQVVKKHNWRDRSLLYLCRTFDNVNKGEDYIGVRPAVHIGLLDFSLFEDSPEFYASYKLMNTKTHRAYSEKFRLNVLELNQAALATQEDRAWKLDKWAGFFKAESWEEIKMLAKEVPEINEAAETVFEISQDKRIRQLCEAREEYIRDQNTTKRLFEMLGKQMREQEERVREQNRQMREQEEKMKEMGQLEEQNIQLKKELEEKSRQLEELTERIRQLEDLTSAN